MAALVFYVGHAARTLTLGEQPVDIGRTGDNQVVLPHPDVSRHHCRVEPTGNGAFRVVDLGSTNGTYLNGDPVLSMTLEDGDQLLIGLYTVHFFANGTPEHAQRSGADEVFPWRPTLPAGRPVDAAAPAADDARRPDDGHAAWRSRGVTRTHRFDRLEQPSASLGLQEVLPQLARRYQLASDELELHELLLTILEELVRCTAYERALLLLHDERTGLLRPVLGRELDLEAADVEVQQFVHRLTRLAIEQQRPAERRASRLDFDPSVRRFPSDGSVESALCLPLLVPIRAAARERRRHLPQRRAIGAIYLDAEQDVGPLSDSELPVIEAVAAFACNALANARLQYEATIDPMTRLCSRAVVRQALLDEIAWSARAGASLGVIMADLDHFKRINDRHGHAAGDEVLKRFARRITRVIRSNDYAFRWGGEEFLVVVPGAGLADTVGIAEKISQAVRATPIGEHRLSITASMGIAMYPDHGADPDILVDRADLALYRAKAAGRDRVCLYEPLGVEAR